MMRMNNIKMTTRVNKSRLLSKLHENLAVHAKIVKEAVVGYIDKACKALEERLGQLREGKLVHVAFSLSPPKDYSEVYRSTIQMLQWTTLEEVELGADEFRQLVEDKWDWTDNFLSHNAEYSATAAYFGGVANQWRPD
jgi:hypothetical protein